MHDFKDSLKSFGLLVLPFTEIIKIELSLNMFFPLVWSLESRSQARHGIQYRHDWPDFLLVIVLLFKKWKGISVNSLHTILYIRLKMKMLTKRRGFFIFRVHVIRTRFLGNLLLLTFEYQLRYKKNDVKRKPSVVVNIFNLGSHIDFSIKCLICTLYNLLAEPGFSKPTNVQVEFTGRKHLQSVNDKNSDPLTYLNWKLSYYTYYIGNVVEFWVSSSFCFLAIEDK